MPYIKKIDRAKFDQQLDEMVDFINKGELEYCVFKLMKKFMSSREARYSSLHDCTYAVQHCADEFRRRYLDKRENEARETNGDIDA